MTIILYFRQTLDVLPHGPELLPHGPTPQLRARQIHVETNNRLVDINQYGNEHTELTLYVSDYNCVFYI